MYFQSTKNFSELKRLILMVDTVASTFTLAGGSTFIGLLSSHASILPSSLLIPRNRVQKKAILAILWQTNSNRTKKKMGQSSKYQF